MRELRIRFGAQLLTGFAKGHEDVIQRSAFRGFPGFRRRLAPLFVITDNDVGAVAHRMQKPRPTGLGLLDSSRARLICVRGLAFAVAAVLEAVLFQRDLRAVTDQEAR